MDYAPTRYLNYLISNKHTKNSTIFSTVNSTRIKHS